MRFRHLDYPPDTPVEQLGPAALDALLEDGDIEAWIPLLKAIRADPHGRLATTVLELCEAHPMYGVSSLWRTWIERLRERTRPAVPLAALRRSRGLTQQSVAQRLGISQSDVSKIERRRDLRLSTLAAYIGALGGELVCEARFADGTEHLRF